MSITQPMTAEEYETAAWEYYQTLPMEHFMEATPQATQRIIAAESFDLLKTRRGDIQYFNELLVQYWFEGKLRRVVPDNMLVIGDVPEHRRSSYATELEPASPFMMFEWVSDSSEGKDYGETFRKYEQELRTPYCLCFHPDKGKWDVYHHDGQEYVHLEPGLGGRVAIPELDLQVGLYEGWIRFWYQGQLLEIPAEQAQRLDQQSEQISHLSEQSERQSERINHQEQELRDMLELLREHVADGVRKRAGRISLTDFRVPVSNSLSDGSGASDIALLIVGIAPKYNAAQAFGNPSVTQVQRTVTKNLAQTVLPTFCLALAWFLSGTTKAADQNQSGQLHRPTALVELADGRLCVANQRSGTVSLIDVRREHTVAEVSVGRRLSDLAVLPDGRHLLVTDEQCHNLILLRCDGDQLNVVNRLKVSPYPVSIRVSHDATRCFVASLWSRSLTIVDLANAGNTATEPPDTSMAVSRTVTLPFEPREQLYLAEHHKLLVADAFGGHMAMLDTGDGAIDSVREIPGHNVRGLALEP